MLIVVSWLDNDGYVSVYVFDGVNYVCSHYDMKVILFFSLFFVFFFFKQKTAYEMRISDWSSDVCSSDLSAAMSAAHEQTVPPHGHGEQRPHVHGHDHGHGDEGAHGTLKGYMTGFLLSVVLTAIPFWIVMGDVSSEERRVGKGGGSTCRARGSPCHSKKKR